MELEAPPKAPHRHRRRKRPKSLKIQLSDTTILQTVVEEDESLISKCNSSECLKISENVAPSSVLAENANEACLSLTETLEQEVVIDDTLPDIHEPDNTTTEPPESTLTPTLEQTVKPGQDLLNPLTEPGKIKDSFEEGAGIFSGSESIKEPVQEAPSSSHSVQEDVDETPVLVMKLEDRIQPDEQSVLDMDMGIFQDVRMSSSASSKSATDHQQLRFNEEAPSTSKRARDAAEFSRVFGIPVSYPPSIIQEPKPQIRFQSFAVCPEQVNQVLAHIPPFQTKFKNSSYMTYHRRKSAERNNNSHEKVPLQTSWNDLAEEYGLNASIDEEAGIMIEYYQMTLRENMLPARRSLTFRSCSMSGDASKHKRASQVTLTEGPIKESPTSPSMKNLYSGTSLLRRNERSKLYPRSNPSTQTQPRQQQQPYHQRPYGEGRGYSLPNAYPPHPGSPKQRLNNTYISLVVDPKTNSLSVAEPPPQRGIPEQKKSQQFQWVTSLKVKTRTALNRARNKFKSLFRKGNSNAPTPVSGATSPVAAPLAGSSHSPTLLIPSAINNAMLQSVNKFESIANVDYKRLPRILPHTI